VDVPDPHLPPIRVSLDQLVRLKQSHMSLAAAANQQMAPAAIPMGPSGGHSHSSSSGQQAQGDACGGGSCCAPTDPNFFVQENFRGDLEGESCLTLELSIGTSCNARACVWREAEMKTQGVLANSSSSVIGFAKGITQEQLDAVLAQCSGSKPKKGAAAVPEGAVQFGLPRDANDPKVQLIDPVELMQIEAMALTCPKYYRRRKDKEGRSLVELSRAADAADAAAAPPAMLPVDFLALLFSYYVGLAEGAGKGQCSDKHDHKEHKKKGGKGKKTSLNLVVPNSFNGATRAKLVHAVQKAGAAVGNVYSRGLAAVAGSLHRDQGQASPLYAALLAHAQAKKNRDTAGISPLTLDSSKGKGKGSGSGATTSAPTNDKMPPFSGPVTVLFIDANDAFVELSLVSCEGGARGRSGADGSDGGANCMGFDRLVSLAHTGLQLDEPEDLWISGTVVEMAKDLLRRAGDFEKDRISVVLSNCMDQTLDDLVRFLEDPNHGGMSSAPGKAYGDVGMPLSPSASVVPSPSNSPFRQGHSGSKYGSSKGKGPMVVKLVGADVARGGCVLSAAELSSSKLFVHEGSENSFNVSHYLSVGEDDSGGIYGVVVYDPNDPPKKEKNHDNRVGNRQRTVSGHKIDIDDKPTEIFLHNLRLTKPNVGPPLKQSLVSKLDYSREFKYSKSKLMYSADAADPISLTGGSRLRLFQQEIVCPHVSGTGLHTIWRLVEDVSPLTGVSGAGEAALVAKASVQIQLSPSTGCAVVTAAKGDAVVDLKSSIWNVINIISFFLFIAFLFFAYKMYGQYVDRRDRQEIVDWITNFYQHNAPEVKTYTCNTLCYAMLCYAMI
jgi:hypothetical protein